MLPSTSFCVASISSVALTLQNDQVAEKAKVVELHDFFSLCRKEMWFPRIPSGYIQIQKRAVKTEGKIARLLPDQAIAVVYMPWCRIFYSIAFRLARSGKHQHGRLCIVFADRNWRVVKRVSSSAYSMISSKLTSYFYDIAVCSI